VTPQNNAAVLLWQAIGRGNLEEAQYAAICREIGQSSKPNIPILQPLDDVGLTQTLADWLAVDPHDGSAKDSIDRILEAARRQPWTSDAIPPLGNWIVRNREPIELIVTACQRSRYYSPSPTLLNGDDDLLISIALPDIDNVRRIARALVTRAMWDLGNEYLSGAWHGLFALHQLSLLVRQAPTLVDQLIAMAISQMAFDGTFALLEQSLPPDLAHQVCGDLSKVERFSTVARSIDQMERLQALDAILQMRAFGPEILSRNADSKPYVKYDWVSMDWNLILRKINDRYDQLAKISLIRASKERSSEFAKFDADVKKEWEKHRGIWRYLESQAIRRKRSEMIAVMISNLMLPAIDAALNAEDRTNSQLDLERIAAALAVYHAEHGVYPETIQLLVPDVLSQEPVDVFSGVHFEYQPDEEGYLLYTRGQNGNDDGGSNALYDIFEGRWLNSEIDAETTEMRDKIPAGADDIAIRVPRPKFEWPRPPSK
jgi:hypothetical protein